MKNQYLLTVIFVLALVQFVQGQIINNSIEFTGEFHKKRKENMQDEETLSSAARKDILTYSPDQETFSLFCEIADPYMRNLGLKIRFYKALYDDFTQYAEDQTLQTVRFHEFWTRSDNFAHLYYESCIPNLEFKFTAEKSLDKYTIEEVTIKVLRMDIRGATGTPSLADVELFNCIELPLDAGSYPHPLDPENIIPDPESPLDFSIWLKFTSEYYRRLVAQDQVPGETLRYILGVGFHFSEVDTGEKVEVWSEGFLLDL